MTQPSKNTDDSPVAGAPENIVNPDLTAVTAESINEDAALALLQDADFLPGLIERLSKDTVATKSRKVKLAIVRHPKIPRYVSLSVMRHLFTFDLMQVALTPVLAGDLKMAAEEALINRLETISAGEKLSLARRASGRIAGALLLDSEPRIISAALENSRLTEVLVTKALLSMEASLALVQAVCTHGKWSLRREIRIALLRNQHTPVEHAVEFAKSLPNDLVREVLTNSRLPENVRIQLAPASDL
jgi:hypothetical protein